MKRYLPVCILVHLAIIGTAQQWQGNNNNTDAIFRTGNVGIGTTTAPTAKFEANNGSTTAPMYFRFDPTEPSTNFRFVNTTTGSGNTIVSITNKRNTGATADGGSTMLSLTYDAANLISAPGLSSSSLALRNDDVYSAFLSFGSSNADFTNNVSTRIFEINGNTGQKFAKIDIATGHADHFRWMFDGAEKMRITSGGNLAIGTSNPGTFKLAVEGKIGAREVQVLTTTPFPDYVFKPDYNLTTLNQLQDFITKNGRLPEMPSASDVEKNGLAVGETEILLVKKVEELTLYIIELNKQVEVQSKQIEAQAKLIEQQQELLEKLLRK